MMDRFLLMLSFGLMIDQQMPRWMPLYDQSFLWAAFFPALGLATRKLRLTVLRPGLVAILAAAMYRSGVPPAIQTQIFENGYMASLALFFGALTIIVLLHESQLIRPSILVVAEIAAVLYLYGQNNETWVDVLLYSGGAGDLIPQAKPIVFVSSLIMLFVSIEIYGRIDIGGQKWYVLGAVAVHIALMLQTVITQVRVPQTCRLLANVPMLAWFSAVNASYKKRQSTA